MKKLIVILILAFSSMNVFTQDEGVYPVGPVVYQPDSKNHPEIKLRLREVLPWWEQKDSLILGWQWDGNKKFNESLKMNCGKLTNSSI